MTKIPATLDAATLDAAKLRVDRARFAAFAASHADDRERERTNEELTAAIDALIALL